MPAGLTSEDMPFGVTFIAPAGHDVALLHLGTAWQQAEAAFALTDQAIVQAFQQAPAAGTTVDLPVEQSVDRQKLREVLTWRATQYEVGGKDAAVTLRGVQPIIRQARLVQDAVIRNLQTLAESSQRLSTDIKVTEPRIPWRELAGFRNVIVHGYLGIDLGAVWLVVELDLPALSDAVDRMTVRLNPAL